MHEERNNSSGYNQGREPKNAMHSSTKSTIEYVATVSAGVRALPARPYSPTNTRCINRSTQDNNQERPFHTPATTLHPRQKHTANNSLQEWYKMEELLERSPTLPRKNQTTASNDGNSPKKLTVNSIRVRETEVDNLENFTKSHKNIDPSGIDSDVEVKHLDVDSKGYAISLSCVFSSWVSTSEASVFSSWTMDYMSNGASISVVEVFQLLEHSAVGIFQLLQHSAFDIFSCDNYSAMK
ncbi:pentatricopeptide repeat-containing protein [Dorcoceras hygrometricum]|uniref:Pentatricopeptide repeat-containing protein n=1 Tax=Dorcoceras hygrometricum TaxID=472368 RepID=A0A2Z7DF32_9LAMI|nr:pentatricopeptide repeat-containing protein [Dorcoceras hygrometricum]